VNWFTHRAGAFRHGDSRRLRVERDPSRLRIVTAMRQWIDGRSEARALAHSARSEHVETHWQEMNDSYSESWRWQSF